MFIPASAMSQRTRMNEVRRPRAGRLATISRKATWPSPGNPVAAGIAGADKDSARLAHDPYHIRLSEYVKREVRPGPDAAPWQTGADCVDPLQERENAVLASLRCGNPTALAGMKPGETVVDLGICRAEDAASFVKHQGHEIDAFGLHIDGKPAGTFIRARKPLS
jgi:hypothetical protein